MSVPVPESMAQNPRWRAMNTRAATPSRYQPDPDGTLYAPFSAREDHIGRRDDAKTEACIQGNLCSACGKPFATDDLYYFTNDLRCELDDFIDSSQIHYTDEPPLHEACLRYALSACPHLRRLKIGAIVAESYAVQSGTLARTQGRYTEERWVFLPLQVVDIIEQHEFLNVRDTK